MGTKKGLEIEAKPESRDLGTADGNFEDPFWF